MPIGAGGPRLGRADRRSPNGADLVQVQRTTAQVLASEDYRAVASLPECFGSPVITGPARAVATFPYFPLAHPGTGVDTWPVMKRAQQTKNTDSKGRLTLGEAFANRTLIVEERGNEIVLHLARVIPEKEAWLYDNPEALGALRRGLKQAKAGQLTAGPDLAKAAKVAKQIRGE